MVYKEGVDPVRDGANKVADAFAFAFTKGFGLQCGYLGTTGRVQPCWNVGLAASLACTWRLLLFSILSATCLVMHSLF